MNFDFETDTETHRMFIALPVPQNIATAVSKAFDQYPQYLERRVPEQKWHVTLLWLGDVENPEQYMSRLRKDMIQSFLPTVRVTHVGRGKQRKQLWAYIDPAVAITTIRNEVIARLKSMRFPIPDQERKRPFIPHIHIADLYDVAGGIGLADYPVPVSFAAREANIVYSTLTPQGSVYETVGTIRLSA